MNGKNTFKTKRTLSLTSYRRSFLSLPSVQYIDVMMFPMLMDGKLIFHTDDKGENYENHHYICGKRAIRKHKFTEIF